MLLFQHHVVFSEHNMGIMITCFEQNDQDCSGFRDPLWNDPDSPQCEAYPDLCNAYQHEGEHPGHGDVCDHVSPRTGITRNVCYFNTIFGAEENEEKTWSYKCWEKSECPLKDENGVAMLGCQVTHKRINCCCDTDFCNGGELIEKFAVWGRADHFPPNFDEMCDYDFGDTLVVFTKEGYEHCSHYPGVEVDEVYIDDNIKEDDTPDYTEVLSEASSDPSDQEEQSSAHAVFLSQLAKNSGATQTEGINVADILLIFTYFVIAAACLCIGVVIGFKFQASALPQQVKNTELDDC